MHDFYLNPRQSDIDVMVVIFVIFFLGAVLVPLIRSVSSWSKDENAELKTLQAKVVSKRQDVSFRRHVNGGRTSSTRYYATFEEETQERLELHMPGKAYGMLVEGDEGRLTYRGTRFESFAREEVEGP